MFKQKVQYYNIIVKSENNKDITLSLMKGKPIIEAIEEFNSHIQDVNKHITELFMYNGNKKININLQYKINTDITVYTY